MSKPERIGDIIPRVLAGLTSTHGGMMRKKWPLLLRETGLVEAVCEHGVGHPVPESAAYKDLQYNHDKGTWGVHGCDGCCAAEDFPETVDRAWLERTTGLDIPEG